jgi:2-polyprenyl-3-methyl-5-hydroxy-6-metoxy-1,4-benzoquinol methylase
MMKLAISTIPAIKYQGLTVACNLCGSDDQEKLRVKDRDGYQSYKSICRECGLIYANPLPTIEELQEYYKKRFDNKRIMGLNGPYELKLRRIYRAALRAIYRYNRIKPFLKAGSRILDTSACAGEFVYLLNAKGFKVRGVEQNPYFIEYARSELGINLENQFLDEINFEAKSFDIITAHHILNLCLDPLAVLRKYHKFLSDDGVLNLEVPNIEAQYTSPHRRFRFKHFYNFNLYTIQALARRAGFEVINTVIIPESMHINIIFKKSNEQSFKLVNVQNYLKVRENVKGYKSLNYLFSSLPYIKAMHNLTKYFMIEQNVKNYTHGRDILKHCYARI